MSALPQRTGTDRGDHRRRLAAHRRLGRFDAQGHLQLFGRKKNMIVTEEGKNIYPEDIEAVFEGLPVKEFCVFAAQLSLAGEDIGQ